MHVPGTVPTMSGRVRNRGGRWIRPPPSQPPSQRRSPPARRARGRPAHLGGPSNRSGLHAPPPVRPGGSENRTSPPGASERRRGLLGPPGERPARPQPNIVSPTRLDRARLLTAWATASPSPHGLPQLGFPSPALPSTRVLGTRARRPLWPQASGGSRPEPGRDNGGTGQAREAKGAPGLEEPGPVEAHPQLARPALVGGQPVGCRHVGLGLCRGCRGP